MACDAVFVVRRLLPLYQGRKVIAAELPNGQLNLDNVFTNAIFRNIVISILATTGLYFIASFLFVGPTLSEVKKKSC